MSYDGRAYYTGAPRALDRAKYCTERYPDGDVCGAEYIARDGDAYSNRGTERCPVWIFRDDEELCDVCAAVRAALEEDAKR